MKKRDRQKKKADMPEFSFKEFTPDESRIYEEAMNSYRAAMASGKTLQQAYDSYAIEDPGLRSIIQADFLKIMIAERHFAQREPLEQLAKAFDVSLDLLKDTLARMLQEVGFTASQQSAAPPKTND